QNYIGVLLTMVFEQVDPLSRGRNERNPGNRRFQQVEESNSRRSTSRTCKRTRYRLCHRANPSGLLRMRDPEASLQDARGKDEPGKPREDSLSKLSRKLPRRRQA